MKIFWVTNGPDSMDKTFHYSELNMIRGDENYDAQRSWYRIGKFLMNWESEICVISVYKNIKQSNWVIGLAFKSEFEFLDRVEMS